MPSSSTLALLGQLHSSSTSISTNISPYSRVKGQRRPWTFRGCGLGGMVVVLLVVVIWSPQNGEALPYVSPWTPPATHHAFLTSHSNYYADDPRRGLPVWGPEWGSEAGRDQRIRHRTKKVRTHVTVPCPFDYVKDYSGKCRKRTAFSLYRLGRK